MPVEARVTDETDPRHDRRSGRLAAQYTQWDESSLPAVKMCRQHPRNDASGLVALKATGSGAERRAGFSGLMTCGSTWSCPVCSHKIASTRAVEVAQAVEKWHAQGDGYRVALATFTLRHKSTQGLRYLWSVLSYGWEKVTSGRGMQHNADEFGSIVPYVPKTGQHAGVMQFGNRLPFVRVVEATHGDNGWHLHVHAVIFLGPKDNGDPQSQADCDRLQASMYRRWSAAVAKDWCSACDGRVFVKNGAPKMCRQTGRPCADTRLSGMRAPSRARGVDVRLVTERDAGKVLGDYFNKAVYDQAAGNAPQRAGFEVTMGQTKTPKMGNRTPFMILRDVVKNGDAADLDLWHEWEQGSKGRRQLTWSPGLREFLGLGDELTDEQVAEDDSLDGDVLVEFDAQQWPLIRRRQGELLAAAEADDTGLALYELLSRLLPLWNRNQSCVNTA